MNFHAYPAEETRTETVELMAVKNNLYPLEKVYLSPQLSRIYHSVMPPQQTREVP